CRRVELRQVLGGGAGRLIGEGRDDLLAEALREGAAQPAQLQLRAEELEEEERQEEPEAPAGAGRVEDRLRVEGLLRRRLERRERVLEGQLPVLHARLAAEVAVRPTANQIENAGLVEVRIGVEAQVAVHQAEAAPARHEVADD